MTNFIDPSWIKVSDYPQNFLPAGGVSIDMASEDGDLTVKGFYDPQTGVYHIQECVTTVHRVPQDVAKTIKELT